MGIAARCATAIVMSEEARMALSGPEVIETANGVDEFDSRDRALVWRTVGGKHRYLIGECAVMVPDSIKAFRNAIRERMGIADDLSLEALEGEHALLRDRVERFGACSDGRDIWKLLGWEDPDSVPVMDHPAFITLSAGRRATSEKVRYEMEIDR
jgi:malonate decarboxylase beta subunit